MGSCLQLRNDEIKARQFELKKAVGLSINFILGQNQEQNIFKTQTQTRQKSPAYSQL